MLPWRHRLRSATRAGGGLAVLALLALPGLARAAVVHSCDEPSLRAAVATDEDITITCEGSIQLTRPLVFATARGRLVTGRNITFEGSGTNRLIEVAKGASLQLRGLTLTGGLAVQGGAVFSDGGSVILDECVLRANRAVGTLESPLPPAGGAIFVKDGQLTVQGSTLISNLCDGGTAPDPKVDATGGAIAVQNTRTQIRDSRFLSNEALGGVVAIPFAYGRGRASGGAFAATNGYLSILRCEFIHNRATLPQLNLLDPLGPGDAQGGAIAHFGQVPLLLEDCLLHGNQIVGSSGGRNGGPGSVRGGALYVQAGSLHGRRLTLTSNRAEGGGGSLARGGQALGGALFAGGKALLEATDFADNEAVAGAGCSCGLQGIPANGDGFGGGAYFSATANLVQCSFQHNRALGPNSSHPNVVPLPGRSQGGAVYATAAMVIVNTTFLANLAIPQRSVGGGVNLEGTAGGAALYTLGLDTRLGAVTVASNLAPSAIATSTGAVSFSSPAATNRMLATILTGGVPNSISGAFLDLGWNLSDEAQPGFTDSSSRASLPPGLGVPTGIRRAGVVLPLLPGSPALDVIPGLGASDLDQRGYPRPTGPRSDIGAYETVPMPRLSMSAPGVVAGRFVLSPDVRYSVEHSADLQVWSPLSVATSDLDGVVTFVADSETWSPQHYFRVVPASPGMSPSNVP